MDAILDFSLIYTRFVTQSNIRWADTDSFSEQTKACYSRNPFLLEDLRNLKICPKCHELYGQVRLGNHKTEKQVCLCDRRNKKKWDGYDFNRKYEICYCCGLEIIPSGSRWSTFYCRDCKDIIVELNKEVGQCIIPIGRHSMMNGIVLTGEQANRPLAVDKFLNNVNKVNNKIDLLAKQQEYSIQTVTRSIEFSTGCICY